MTEDISDQSTSRQSGSKEDKIEMVHLIGNIDAYVTGEEFGLYKLRLGNFLSLNKITDAKAKVDVLASFGGADLFKALHSLVQGVPTNSTRCKFEITLTVVVPKCFDSPRLKRQFSTIFTMERYTPKERAEIVKFYFENNSSVVLCQRAYRRKYRKKRVPNSKTIRNLAAKFSEHGHVASLPRKKRQRGRRSMEAIASVQADVREHPTTSVYHRSQQFAMSKSSMWRLLHIDLSLFPYKVQTCQQLKAEDKPRRLQYATNMQNLMVNEPDFWNELIMTDEAHFKLNGSVNTQNLRYWGTENPHVIHEEPLHSPYVTVWCGVCAERIIGPYFFENDEGETVTVNGDRYRAMLRGFLANELAEHDITHFWFQQDGATCHTARATMDILRQMFPGRLISKSGDFDWPPRSPDLTAPDFFLWGYLKSKVYANKPQTLEQLKANIRQEIAGISTETLRKTMENAEKRTDLCMAANGGHLPDIIFKK